MRKFTLATAVVVFALLAVVSWAAGPASSPATGNEKPMGMMHRSAAFTPEILKAKELNGMKVENPKGESLGKIEDIVLTDDRNRVAYVAVTFGGVLGMGEKYCAVPWSALEKKSGATALILNKDLETLKGAPSFNRNNWPNMADASWIRTTNEFYGQQSTPETMMQHPTTEKPLETAAASSAQMENRRVSKLLDLKVINAQDQKIGEIKDIAIDTYKGDAVFGIISLAKSVSQTGADMAAVPWNSLSIQPDLKSAQLSVDKSVLDAVAFKASEYPNLADREFTRRTYEQFNRQPYWDVLGYTAPGSQLRERVKNRMMEHQNNAAPTPRVKQTQEPAY